jgi:hypothetical protein
MTYICPVKLINLKPFDMTEEKAITNKLFKDLSNDDFINDCKDGLEEIEEGNRNALLCSIICHVNQYAHDKANETGEFSSITYGDVFKVAQSLLIREIHGYLIFPY